MDQRQPQGGSVGAAAGKEQQPRPGFIMPPAQVSTGEPDTPKPLPKPAEGQHPLPVAHSAGLPTAGGARISAFGREKKHEEIWARTPNTTGNGAIHVKTFHCKLTEDALMYMDQTINEWLDAHPQYEVKFVSSTIGTMTGKLKEPALFCQVWV